MQEKHESHQQLSAQDAISKFNTLKNMLDFERMAKLEADNDNHLMKIELLEKEVDRMVLDSEGKKGLIRKLGGELTEIKRKHIVMNNELTELKVSQVREAGQRKPKTVELAEYQDALDKISGLEEKVINLEQREGELTIGSDTKVIQNDRLKLQVRQLRGALDAQQHRKQVERHPDEPEIDSRMVELQHQLAKQRVENVSLQREVDGMQHVNQELTGVNSKYNDEVVAHHRLNADIEILKARLSTFEEGKTPHFYDFFSTSLFSQKERFLNILSMYLDEIVRLKHDKSELQERVDRMETLVSGVMAESEVQVLEIRKG